MVKDLGRHPWRHAKSLLMTKLKWTGFVWILNNLFTTIKEMRFQVFFVCLLIYLKMCLYFLTRFNFVLQDHLQKGFKFTL